GQCFVFCPESAIPPIVISAETFIKSAVEQAQVKGTPMTLWTPPVIKNFAKMINQALSRPTENMTTLGGILPEILITLAGQMKIEGERLQMLTEQFHAMTPMLHSFPVAVTKTFFTDCEKQAKGSGNLFSVAINPQSCTGCGICSDVCPEAALVMNKQNREYSAQLESQFRVWEQLPDTPADVIQRMIQDKAYDSFAAILLSRNYYMSMAGGFNTGKSSSEKMMMHLVTAVTESLAQSRMNTVIKEVEQRIQALSEKIQNKLREALPTSNFDALMNSIARSEHARVSLDTVLRNLSETQRFGIVETAWMERIVTLINDLKSLTWTLSKGPTGVGRARFGAVLAGAGSMAWAKQFPYNAFTSPVAIYDHPDSTNFIHGLCHGHIRQMLDNVKLLRRADLEMQNEYDPTIHDERLANLTWHELTDNEKIIVPPVFVITDYKTMSEMHISSLLGLLSSGYPVKVFLFDSASGSAAYWRGRMAITTAVLSLRNTFYLQSSMAKKDHFFKGLTDGLRHATPGFFHLLTPPGIDCSENSFQLALQSRAFPLLRFAPSIQKSAFSTVLDLSANPDPYEDHISLKFEKENSAGSTPAKYVLTFADWAFHQPELRDQFTLMDDQDLRGVPVNEYVVMGPEACSDKIPYIVSVNEQNSFEKYQVSKKIISAVEAANESWAALREMAGMLTPYPEKLKERIEEEWSVKHTAALEQLKADYEEKFRQLENVQLEKIKQKLSDKLMALSGYQNK
ncbi:4Fe-4S binding protein, partial [bacterium]|nr:4Fe-4S binding protein [bacterium]